MIKFVPMASAHERNSLIISGEKFIWVPPKISLLDLNDINYQFSDTKTELRASEIFETVNPSVVLLECWGF